MNPWEEKWEDDGPWNESWDNTPDNSRSRATQSPFSDEPPGFSAEDMARIAGEMQNRERLNQGFRKMTAGDSDLLASVATSFAPKQKTPDEIKQEEFAKRAGATPIPLGLRIGSGLHTGISQGIATPGKVAHSLADIALTGVGAGQTRLGKWNADMLRQYADYENWMNQKDAQTFGDDIAQQLATGTGRAFTELPMYLAAGAGAATPAQAVARSSSIAGLIGGGSEYARDRGAGMEAVDALPYAVSSGLITALTTRAFGATGAESIFRKEGVKGLRNRITSVLKSAGMEGAEEAADEFQQDFLERLTRNPDKPVEETIREVLMALAVGGIVGGSVSGVQNIGGAAQDVAQSRRLDQSLIDTANEEAMLGTLPPQTGRLNQNRGQDLSFQQDQPGKLDMDYINQQLEAGFDARERSAEAKPIESATTAQDSEAQLAADESGFTLVKKNQAGGFKLPTESELAAMPPEDAAKYREMMKMFPPEWEFTDNREGSPTEGITVYAPIGASKSEILDLINKKSATKTTTKGLGGEEIAQMLGVEFRGEAGKDGSLLQFEAKKTDGTPSTSFYIKKGATADEVRAKYQEVINRYKDDPQKAPRPIPTASKTPATATATDAEPMVTLYRGAEDQTAGGQFWSSDPDYAAKFGGNVQTITIPKSQADAARKAFTDTGSGTPNAYILPPEIAKQATSMEKPPEAKVYEIDKAESESPDITTGALGEVGMGGAKMGEVAPQGTALKNAAGELERATSGFPEAYKTQRRAMLPAWIEAGQLLEQDPQAGYKLAADLKVNPERGMTDVDSALLLRHKVALENAKNQAAEETHTATTPEAKLEAQNRFDDISNQLLDLLDAAKFRGAQWGREGRWRQALAFEDFSLETMRRDARMAADRELTQEEEADIKRRHEKIAADQKKVAEAEEKAAKEEKEKDQKDAVDDAVKEAKARTKKDKAAGIIRDMDAEQAEVVNFLKDEFQESGNLLGANKSIRKLMELLVEREGITERLPLETRVHEILSQIDPSLTREAVMDLMSGYGKAKVPSQEPAKKIVRDISQQIISVRKLLDYFKGKRPSLTGMLRDAPSDIQRAWLKMVNEAKKNFKLEGPTNDPKAIKSAIDAINTRLKNRISDLKQEIATRQKIIRERSPSPYNAETLALRKELEALQAERDAIFGSGLTPAEQLAQAEKSAERQIAELQRQIDSGEIFPKSKQRLGLRSDKLDAAKAKIEELKLQRQFAREAIQPKPDKEVTATEAKIKSLDRQIEQIETQLKNDEVFSKPKSERTKSEDARVVEREKRLSDLKEQRQFARERLQPGLDPEQAFLLNYLMRLSRQEADYKERLAKGDFAKKQKAERELSPEVLAAKARVEKAKSDFRKAVAQYELNRRSRNQKIWDSIKATKNAFVNIISSYDFSAPRQAFTAILGNISRLLTSPKEGAKMLATPFRDMFKAWFSEEWAAMIEQWIKNRPNALSGADKKAGIQYTGLHNPIFTKREENAASVLDEWAALPLKTGNALKSVATAPFKVGAKGVRTSNRAFITYLNVTRAVLFDQLLKTHFSDRPPTDAELKVIGNIVNLATGRGDLSPGVAKVASEILWAPSLLASRVQTMTGQPFWGKAGREGGSRARKIVAQEYARWITSGAVLYAISKLFDEDDEEVPPTSADFGKIRRGKTRIDPWAGFQQVGVLEARLLSGETTSSTTGQTRAIDKMGTGDVIWNFVKNKTRPDLKAIVNGVVAAVDSGKDPSKVRVTIGEAAKEAIPVPLAMSEVIEVMRDRGMSEGAIVSALAIFGVGVSVYDDDTKAKERQK